MYVSLFLKKNVCVCVFGFWGGFFTPGNSSQSFILIKNMLLVTSSQASAPSAHEGLVTVNLDLPEQNTSFILEKVWPPHVDIWQHRDENRLVFSALNPFQAVHASPKAVVMA